MLRLHFLLETWRRAAPIGSPLVGAARRFFLCMAYVRMKHKGMDVLLRFLRRNRGEWTAEPLRNRLKVSERTMSRMLTTASKYQAVHVNGQRGEEKSYRARPSMRAACDLARNEGEES